MDTPKNRISYMKLKYIQRIPLGQIQFSSPWEGGRKTTADVLEGFAPSRSTPEEEGGRKTVAGVLEGFAPGFANQRFALRLGSSTLACLRKGGGKRPLP